MPLGALPKLLEGQDLDEFKLQLTEERVQRPGAPIVAPLETQKINKISPTYLFSHARL